MYILFIIVWPFDVVYFISLNNETINHTKCADVASISEYYIYITIPIVMIIIKQHIKQV